MRKYIYTIVLLLLALLSISCGATIIGDYNLRKDKKWYQTKYEARPRFYIKGSGGKIEGKDKEVELKGERTKGSLINLGTLVDNTTTEVD